MNLLLMTSPSNSLHLPSQKRETLGVSHLVIACGVVTGDKKAFPFCFVPHNGPTSHCEMTLTQFSSRSLKWRIVSYNHGLIVLQNAEKNEIMTVIPTE